VKFTTRPIVRGRRGVLSSGHQLATAAGYRMFERGGNAFDAAVAAGFALQVLEPCENGPGGEASIILYPAREGRVRTLCAQGFAPAAATIQRFRSLGLEWVPDSGLLPATVPGAVGGWLLMLREYGTLSVEQVLEPARELAAEGFPVFEHLHEHIAQHREVFSSLWPTTGDLYLRDGDAPPVGSLLKNPALAQVYRRMMEAAGKHSTREDQIRAAHRSFYQGETAEAMAAFCRQEVPTRDGEAYRGLITAEDLKRYRAQIEEPVEAVFGTHTVYKNGPWCQGPVFLQQLKLLERLTLEDLEPASAEFFHVVVESWKLAAADRLAYYGDPRFDRVPLEWLLSDAYNDQRAALIDRQRASGEIRPGRIPGHEPFDWRKAAKEVAVARSDTTFVCAADNEGNLVAATPSGGWIMSSPVIPELGFPLGTRGVIFHLDERRPNALAPGKRPRTTLTPTLVADESGPFLAFGTPGGDSQDQLTLQFYLYFTLYGYSLQEAVEAPFAVSSHHVDSFSHSVRLNEVQLDRRAKASAPRLEELGHVIRLTPQPYLGQVQAVTLSRAEEGRVVLSAAAAPGNCKTCAFGW